MISYIKKIISLIIILAIGIFLFWFSKQEYKPNSLLLLSQQFIDEVQKNRFAEAYELTNKSRDVGSTLTEFKEKVSRQLVGREKMGSIVLDRFSTHQTYGNRLRRWLRGRKVEVDVAYVDYIINNSDGNLLCLFEVRFTQTKLHWKISYFQSHAG